MPQMAEMKTVDRHNYLPVEFTRYHFQGVGTTVCYAITVIRQLCDFLFPGELTAS
ncbi:hypothetical protein POSPLADRAFT_1041994 [Postia placenta MAD-698-R-SB12]|uniref:Uncharacterized protein n=1 Tax=Postia placenta MAD-698-R-SB12 TaxID=670580 RepID=A0A1X6MIU2_9APHY|nr:hypothetical protein POSPLADRAFT_1041994 [Postia placenta MAD-698-R-SB12]OSX56229.1 hypothetical protein POSPLADRAFT_1041994 [Postia placenta MAD-698-R-SB12]